MAGLLGDSSLARGRAFMNLVVHTSWAHHRHRRYLCVKSQGSCTSSSLHPFPGLTLTPLLQLHKQQGQ